MTTVKGKNVLVLGLGRFGGGVEVVKFLINNNAKVRVSDSSNPQFLSDSINNLKDFPVEFRFGPHREEDLGGIDLVVVNPAITLHHPYLTLIANKKIPITTEVNLFFERCRGKIIAVTGTNGKETVINLIAQILIKMGQKVLIGGNIGHPLINQLDQISKGTQVIFELSSFQLERLKLIKKRPEIAIITNIFSDHLDWHSSQANYIDAKFEIFNGQKPTDLAIVNIDDPIIAENISRIKSRLVKVSSTGGQADVGVKNNQIVALANGQAEILSSTNLTLPGRHNLENVALACACAWELGAGQRDIEPVVTNFVGVKNALEFLGSKNGIDYFNDSEATNPQATIAAINSFDRPTWIILGGYDKKIDYQPMLKLIAKKACGVAIIGQLADQFSRWLSAAKSPVKFINAKNLATAFSWIQENSKSGEIVLLSPGTSSYDQYKNLGERAEEFKKLVSEVPSES